MRIYVASSWRNEHQQYIVNVLREAGHEVYDFKHPTSGDAGFHWSEIDPNWQDWTIHQYCTALGHDHAKFGFNRDFDAMKAADACVLVLPCGRSAHLEAGWMKGAGKKVLAYIPCDYRMEPELMYKMLDGITNDIQGILTQLKDFSHCDYCLNREAQGGGRIIMDKDAIKKAVLECLAVGYEGSEPLNENTQLKLQNGYDLLDVVEVVIELEDKFDIELPDADVIGEILTAGELINMVIDEIEKKNAGGPLVVDRITSL